MGILLPRSTDAGAVILERCVIDGCDNPRHANGWCKAHYLRWYRSGSPEGVYKRSLEDRFWRYVTPGAPDECWIWRGNKTPNGYGRIYISKGNIMGAHRVSHELHHGPIPDGHFVLHSCDNPSCVNPAHLRSGTPKENTGDMIAKGRKVKAAARGERSALAVLNEHAVRFIRSCDLNNSELARIFGMTPNAIRAIRIRKSWRHIE